MTDSTMKAIRQEMLGEPEVMKLGTLPKPSPGSVEILVRVRAAGINPVDFKTRRSGGPLGRPPFTVGWDVAGVVEEIGYGVTRFAVGDRVFGMPKFPGEAAAYAEFVVAPSRQFALIPDGVDFVQAAALPLAGLTAWQSLIDFAGVAEGQRVLILAAAGGVGSLAVQLAKEAGAHVIGTARAKHHEYLTGLGADELIDYTETDVGATVRDVDVVLDLVGGATGVDSVPCLRDGGLIITVPSGTNLGPLKQAAAGRVRVSAFLVEPDRLGMDRLAELAGAGKLTARVARTYPLADAAVGHDAAEAGPEGKIVLTVD
jgi:NADPH:quinone reductase-like Zn-dependent oxidoreductase